MHANCLNFIFTTKTKKNILFWTVIKNNYFYEIKKTKSNSIQVNNFIIMVMPNLFKYESKCYFANLYVFKNN